MKRVLANYSLGSFFYIFFANNSVTIMKGVIYMSSVITDEQKNIIANLANEVSSDECNALIRFGGQMYRDGLLTGAALAMIGIGAGLVVWSVIEKKLIEKKLK